MAKKKWTTVNINDFFAPEQGPAAPVRLTSTSTPPPPPVSKSAAIISSSGEIEKIPTSKKRFDDEQEYISRRRGKNRGGRGRKGRVPTPHIQQGQRTLSVGTSVATQPVDMTRILYNRKLELRILNRLKSEGQVLEFLSNTSVRESQIKAGRIVPMNKMQAYISRVDRLVENNMQIPYLSQRYGTDNLLNDQPNFIRPKTTTNVNINNLTDPTRISLGSVDESINNIENVIGRNRARQMRQDYVPSSVSRYLQTASISSNQPAANIASAVGETMPTGTPGRMTSSIAQTLADDTMRAASVIHSSKLGFAAIGMGALGAAFGISSLRGRSIERQKELERG